VRELAALTATDPGYVSRVISLLETEALLRRGGKGSATEVAWPALLRRWAQDAPLASRGAIGTYLAPRGLGALQQQLSSFEGTYAITGSMAADALAPLASPRLATIWVSDAAAASLALSLPQVDSGANVLLVEAPDGTPFERRVARDGVWHANPALVAADLLTSPGRGPQEGEALITWMMRNEAAWRR
jgi:ABC-type transporter Mla MlaB component